MIMDHTDHIDHGQWTEIEGRTKDKKDLTDKKKIERAGFKKGRKDGIEADRRCKSDGSYRI